MCDPAPHRLPCPRRGVSRVPPLLAAATIAIVSWAGISVAVWAVERPSQDRRVAVTGSPLSLPLLVQTPASDGGGDEVPEAALLTEEGAALAARLRQLRRSESRMGPRHPALPEVRAQIEQIRTQLREWQSPPNPFRVGPAPEPPGEAPVRHPPGSETDTRDIMRMNDRELRRLVLGLAREVRELRQRLDAIENRPGSRDR